MDKASAFYYFKKLERGKFHATYLDDRDKHIALFVIKQLCRAKNKEIGIKGGLTRSAIADHVVSDYNNHIKKIAANYNGNPKMIVENGFKWVLTKLKNEDKYKLRTLVSPDVSKSCVALTTILWRMDGIFCKINMRGSKMNKARGGHNFYVITITPDGERVWEMCKDELAAEVVEPRQYPDGKIVMQEECHDPVPTPDQ